MSGKPSGAPAGLSGIPIWFLLGVLLLQQMPRLPQAGWVLAALLLAWGLYRGSIGLRWLAPVVLGFAWAWLHAYWALQQTLPADLEGRDLVLTGHIAGLPEQRGSGWRFMFEPDGRPSIGSVITYTGRLRLSWYRDAPPLHSGERWRLRVRLKRPHGFANPGGFDYEGWLFRQGIRATGYVKKDAGNIRLSGAGGGVDSLRQTIRDRLSEVQSGPGMGLVTALSIGDRSGMGPDLWEVFTRTGTNHLIAISGLHVGIMAGMAFFLVRFLWSRSASLCRRLPHVRAAALAALAAAGSYSALAGFSISTQRALLMLSVVFLALFLGRTLRPLSGLLTALFLVLLVDPPASLSPGFWLSFAAVAALIFALAARVAPYRGIRSLGRAQWAVALGLLPLLFLLFGKASLAAVPVNLIAVPLFSLLLLPVVLISVFTALVVDWTWPLESMAWLLEQGIEALRLVAAQPWSAWSLPDRPGWVWALALLGSLWLLAPRGLPGRAFGLLMLLPMFVLPVARPAPGAFHFSLLDVGQGLAAVVHTHGHTLVFDTGPRFPSGFNTGSSVLAPYLRALGIKQVDRLLVSHGDQDHAGGADGLLRNVPVRDALGGEPYALSGVRARQCREGDQWEWEGVGFRILHPGADLAKSSNNRSCILQVSNQAGTVLLTGDAEISVEQHLVEKYGQALASDVLVAGHHGSNTSSSETFLQQVRPDHVLIAAGYRNRYGFPKPAVIERIISSGALPHGTVEGGAIRLVFPADGNLRGPEMYRKSQCRYWSRACEF